MKKIISLMIVVMLLISCVPAAFAASGSAGISSAEGKAGETVTVYVSYDVADASDVLLIINYGGLTAVNVNKEFAAPGATNGVASIQDTFCSVAIGGTSNSSFSGKFAVQLTIPADAQPGTVYTLGLEDGYISDVEGVDGGSVYGGTVTVIAPECEHAWGEWTETKAPTCTEAGEETRTCSKCDATETRTVEALGHNVVKHDAKAATCTEAGWEAYETCSRCDYSTYAEIPALGHDWQTKWSFDNAFHWHDCSRCSETKDHAEHTMVEVEKTGNEKDGFTVKNQCNVCGYNVTTNIPGEGKPEQPVDPDVPETGDITPHIMMAVAAMISMVVAVVYVFKRKTAK